MWKKIKPIKEIGHWKINFSKMYDYNIQEVFINIPMNLPNSSSWDKYAIEERICEMLEEFQQKVHEEFAWVYEEWLRYEKYHREEE